jgi:hypothetical protein
MEKLELDVSAMEGMVFDEKHDNSMTPKAYKDLLDEALHLNKSSEEKERELDGVGSLDDFLDSAMDQLQN